MPDEGIDWRTPFEALAEKEEGGELGRELSSVPAEALTALCDFAAERPASWRAVRERLRRPHASYADIGAATKMSKDTARRALSDASGRFPWLRRALGVSK